MADIKVVDIYGLTKATTDEDATRDWLPISRQNSENSDARTTLRMPYPKGDADVSVDCTVCEGTGKVSKVVDGERVEVDCDHCSGTGIEPSGAVTVSDDGIISIKPDGTSITVESGKLTAHGTYEAGTAIDISDNTIGVKIDGKSVKTDDDGNLTVGLTGEDGVDVSDGVVSAKLGSGLTLDNGNIAASVDGKTIIVNENNKIQSVVEVEEGDGILADGMKVSVKNGTGLGFDTAGGLKVKIDNDTIKTNSEGNLYINKEVQGGTAITVTGTKVSVNVGDGLSVDGSNSVIVNADGKTVKVVDGKVESVVTAGDGIAVDSDDNTVSVKLANESGLDTTSDGLKLNIDNETIKIDPDTHKVFVNKVPEPGIGITVDGNEVSARLGRGLSYNDDNAIVANIDDSTIVIKDQKIAANVTAGNGIDVDHTDNTVSVKAAENGGIISSEDGVKVSVDGTSIGLDADGKLHTIAPEGNAGDGLVVVDGKYAVKPNAGIEVSSEGVSAKVDGTSIVVSSDGSLSAKTSVEAGNGIEVTDGNKVSLKTAEGGVIVADPNGLSINLGDGLAANNGTLTVVLEDGKGTVADGDKVDVNVGNGLEVNEENKVEVKVDGSTVKFNADGSLESIPPVKEGKGIEFTDGYTINVDYGDGLTVDDDNKVKVDVDGSTIVITADGKVANGLTGDVGISIDDNKVSANVGDGLKVDATNKIVPSVDGKTVTVVDGKLTSTSDLVASDGITINNHKISTKLELNGGLGYNDGGSMHVNADGTTIVVSKTTGKVSGNYQGADGITVAENKISVNADNTLKVNETTHKVGVNYDSKTITRNTDGTIKVADTLYKAGDGVSITTDDDGRVISANIAKNGGLNNSSSGLSVLVDDKTIGRNEDGKLYAKYTAGKGINISDKAVISTSIGDGLKVDSDGNIAVAFDAATSATMTSTWPSKVIQDAIQSSATFIPAYLMATMESTKLTCAGDRFSWTTVASKNVELQADGTYKVGDDDNAIINQFKVDVTFTIECPTYLTNFTEYVITVDQTHASTTNDPSKPNTIPAVTFLLDTTNHYSTFTFSSLVLRDTGSAPYFAIYIGPVKGEEGETVPELLLSAKIEGIGF